MMRKGSRQSSIGMNSPIRNQSVFTNILENVGFQTDLKSNPTSPLKSIIEIRNLKTNSVQETLICKFIKILLNCNQEDQNCCIIVIGDSTAIVHFILINVDLNDLILGHWYRFENIRSKMVNGFIYIVSDPFEFKHIEPDDPIVDQPINFNLNISNIEYQQYYYS
ncbi:hypothetical protein BC833DRAFT_580730 [Globomyces pollinis-pini]|nr:hypothetical protein BC833DRAFT_580730 [Globomyces pollinis-pini]